MITTLWQRSRLATGREWAWVLCAGESQDGVEAVTPTSTGYTAIPTISTRLYPGGQRVWLAAKVTNGQVELVDKDEWDQLRHVQEFLLRLFIEEIKR